MAFGVTEQGFKLKRLADIQVETTESMQAAFGAGINLQPESFLGQIKGILDEREALIWELAQAIYNSQYPQTASGASLDSVASLNAISRLKETRSTVLSRIFGDLGATVPVGFTASVLGNESAKFETTSSDTIHAGIDEVQKISFSSIPTSGSFKLGFNGEETGLLDQTTTAIDIENALNGLSGVTVSGDFSIGFTVTFTGSDGQINQSLLQFLDNTLQDGGSVTITITEETAGILPFVDITMTAQAAGPIIANTGSLTEIETPESGIDSITNIEDAQIGRSLETDPDLKIRRILLLKRSGTATVEGIRNNVLNVQDVIQALLIENTLDVPDIQGRPPKSFEVFVLGGDEDEIAQSIFEARPAGIETVGTITRNITDSQGIGQIIKFSRPTEVEIYIIVNITPNLTLIEGPLYPIDGDVQVKTAILNFIEGLSIGQDVVLNQLYTPINSVPGVIGIEILIGTSPSPTQSNNLNIENTEIAVFDSSRITVNS